MCDNISDRIDYENTPEDYGGIQGQQIFMKTSTTATTTIKDPKVTVLTMPAKI